MKFKHFIPVATVCAMLFFTWNCEKGLQVPDDGNNNNNGNTTDTIYFTIEGVKFSNGRIADVSYTSARVEGAFSSVANAAHPIQEHGFVWATDKNNLKIGASSGSTALGPKTTAGQFVSDMTGLTPNTTYFVTGYVTSNGITNYHPNPLSFKTLEGKAPLIATGVSSGITHNEARIENIITDFIGTDVLEHGHIWGDNPNINLNNSGGNKTAFGAVSEVDDYSFSSVIQGLQASKQYYYKAYATNQFGTSYSTVATFTTLPTPTPNFVIQNVSIAEPNGTGTVNPGEDVTLTISLKNTGNANASNVNLSIGISPFYSIVSPLPVHYSDIIAGGQKDGNVTIKVGNDVPWGTIVVAPVTLSDANGGSWSFPTEVAFTVMSPYVVSNGLVFYTRFNECAGPTTSSVIGSYTGDLFGSAFSNDVIPGTTGCALEFNSQDKDYLQFASNPMFGLATVSVSFWMKTYSGNCHLFCAVSGNYNLKINDNKFFSENLALSMDGYSLNAYLDGINWHHFVLVQDENDKAKLYIDGVLKFERNAYSFSSNNGTGWFLGRNYSQFDSYFNGKMDNFRIYNRPLSSTEVTQIFNAKQ